ncbi:unnamed protein product [Urochloa humidicola]
MVGAVVGIFVARLAVVVLSVAAFICALRAQDVNFTALVFLKGSLLALILSNVLRLFYDAAQVFLHIPLPPDHVVFFVLVVADCVAAVVLLTAGSSSTAVLVFFQMDTMACG